MELFQCGSQFFYLLDSLGFFILSSQLLQFLTYSTNFLSFLTSNEVIEFLQFGKTVWRFFIGNDDRFGQFRICFREFTQGFFVFVGRARFALGNLFCRFVAAAFIAGVAAGCQ